MKTVVCARAELYSVWITHSEISAILGERFANSLRDSYASLFERVDGKPYELDRFEKDPSFRLDLVFKFVNEFYNK